MTEEPEGCLECPFRDWGYVEPDLKESNILFVGENPGGQDVKDNKVLSPKSDAGAILKPYLKQFDNKGITYSLTYAVKCHSPGDKEPGLKVIRRCRPLLEQDIAETKPKLIVAFGKTAMIALTDLRKGVKKLNGHVLREQEIPILICLHPETICHSKEPEKAEKQFEKGIMPALYFFDEQEKLPYAIKRTLQPTEEEVGFDIETNELNPLVPGARMRCFAVSNGQKAYFVKMEGEK
jgi:uracil-DNA glycosylase family 4